MFLTTFREDYTVVRVFESKLRSHCREYEVNCTLNLCLGHCVSKRPTDKLVGSIIGSESSFDLIHEINFVSLVSVISIVNNKIETSRREAMHFSIWVIKYESRVATCYSAELAIVKAKAYCSFPSRNEDSHCCPLRLWWSYYFLGHHHFSFGFVKLSAVWSKVAWNRTNKLCLIVDKFDKMYCYAGVTKGATLHQLRFQ